MIVIKFALLMGIIGVITEEGHFKASSLLTVPLFFCFFYILTLFFGGGSYLSSMVPYLATPPHPVQLSADACIHFSPVILT